MEAEYFGSLIRRTRIEKGWTQLDLARRVEVDPSTISDWERGEYGFIGRDHARRVEFVLSLQVGEITNTTPLSAKYHLAFGEWKTLSDWAHDARCVVSRHALHTRLRLGWTLEQALTFPRGRPLRNRPAQWIKELIDPLLAHPQCIVSRSTLVSRLGRDWDPLEAISTPLYIGVKRKTAARRVLGCHYTAFNETKTLIEWSEDPRCVVSYKTLHKRIKDGYPIEEALTATNLQATKGKRAWNTRGRPVVQIFGETKSMTEWADDPRCTVALATFRFRLRHGWNPEDALTLPAVIGRNGSRKV